MNRRQFLPMLAAPVLAPRRSDAKDPDWPQWRGPNRDGLSSETGLLSNWPNGGPKAVWKSSGLGSGYGTVAIAGDRIYVQGTRENESVVWCLNRADGKQVWHAPLGKRMDQDRGPGPRGTPTVDGDRVYALSENGDLACILAKDATGVWHKNILADFRGRNPHWLISESPLVEGKMLVFSPENVPLHVFELLFVGVQVDAHRRQGAGGSTNILFGVGGIVSCRNLRTFANRKKLLEFTGIIFLRRSLCITISVQIAQHCRVYGDFAGKCFEIAQRIFTQENILFVQIARIVHD